jgi:ribosome maturation protein SDO1
MRQTFDKERINESIARLKTHGENFEVVIDPENAVKVRHGEADVRDALKAPHVYKDVQKGELVSEDILNSIFKTTDESKVAEKIIKEGELHFNDEYKEQLRSNKKRQIISILLRDGAEANTGLPLTERKLMSAFTHANVHIDLYKNAEDQLPEIISKLRTALPLTLERKTLIIRIPSANAPKLYGFVTSRSRVVEEAWLSDGSYSCKADLPAGMVAAFLDELKKSTHGDVEVSIEAKKTEIKKK